MHGAGVVPHEGIAITPGMAINEAGLHAMVKELLQCAGTLFGIPADNLSGHARANIQRFLSGDGVGSHQRVRYIR